MLYEQSNYVTPLDYFISSYIREYDISKANINILLYKGLISRDQYDYFYNLDRMSRQVEIGMMQRDNPVIRDAINHGFAEVRKLFFEANDIKDHEVIAIKKDAVYVLNKIPSQTTFGNIEFVCKNIYTSFYKVNKLELYYYCDSVNNREVLDVKGISDKALLLHNDYFLEFLLVLFSSAQIDPIEETIGLLQHFYAQYLSFKLDVGYYRNFNNRSLYLVKSISDIARFEMQSCPEDKKQMIDISYNASLIREFYKIYSNIYFQTKNKN